jgi:hypothetical protein
MIGGDSLRRNSNISIMADINGDSPTQDIRQQKTLGFTCLDYGSSQKEGALTRYSLSNKGFLDDRCSDGLRLKLDFLSF